MKPLQSSALLFDVFPEPTKPIERSSEIYSRKSISIFGLAFKTLTDDAVCVLGCTALCTTSAPLISPEAVEHRTSAQLVDLDTLEENQSWEDCTVDANRRLSAATLFDLIYRLKPIDRQIILLYLEGEEAADIAGTTGLNPSNVATKIHRIKKLLTRQHTKEQEMKLNDPLEPQSTWKAQDDEKQTLRSNIRPEEVASLARSREKLNKFLRWAAIAMMSPLA